MEKQILGLAAKTGTAAAPHKDNLEKFVFKPGTWAWKRFKTKSKWLTKENHFTFVDATLMESAALGKLLKIDFTTAAKGVDDPEGYVYKAIENALTNAAQKIADDRRLWGASRRSLDATTGEGEDSRTFGELVTTHGDLRHQSKALVIPRPIAYRWALNRNKKDVAAKSRILLKIVEDVSIMLDSDNGDEVPEEEQTLEPLEPVTPQEEAEEMKGDDFAADSEDLNRVVFDPKGYHRKAVAEVGFMESDDDCPPQTQYKSSPMGFGGLSEEEEEQGLRVDVSLILEKIKDEEAKKWCRRVLDGWDPVYAYKFAGIKKNDYYKKLLPQLRKVFAALKPTGRKGRN